MLKASWSQLKVLIFIFDTVSIAVLPIEVVTCYWLLANPFTVHFHVDRSVRKNKFGMSVQLLITLISDLFLLKWLWQ